MNHYENNRSSSEKRQNTRFDLDKLRAVDTCEISKTSGMYELLSQTQRDLIRHQAPDAYAAIVAIVNAAKGSQRTAFQAQAHASTNFHNFSSKQANNRFSTRDEKNDSYGAADRAHERTTRSNESQNASNNASYVTIAVVTSLAIVTGVAMVVFGGAKKS